ncbi:hypothetical protein [Vibrio phage YC]|uniref:Uncharacterized protein n=1 Tax=Vibrio phage YC TaxID=2267403 RepID=A0A384ZS59_9CAUD|nr:hypothetical protein HWB64_gp096 [Vibrio phage YC]AXC34465.1 hypothetical protein [Vibrio phage YC]
MKSFIQRHLSTLSESDALLTEAFNSKPYEITMTKKGASDILFGFETDEGTEYQIRFRNFPKLGKNIRRVTVRQKQGSTFKDVVKKFDDGMRVMATMIAAVEMFVTTPMGKATDGFALDMSKKAAPRASKIFAKALKRNKVFKKYFEVVDTIAGSDEAVTTAWAVAKGKTASDVFSGPDAEGLLPDTSDTGNGEVDVDDLGKGDNGPKTMIEVQDIVIDYLQNVQGINIRKVQTGTNLMTYNMDMGSNVVMSLEYTRTTSGYKFTVLFRKEGVASASIPASASTNTIKAYIRSMMNSVNEKFGEIVSYEVGFVKGHLKGRREGHIIKGTFGGYDIEIDTRSKQLMIGDLLVNDAPVDNHEELLKVIIDRVNEMSGKPKQSKTESFIAALMQTVKDAGLNTSAVTTVTKGQMVQVYSNSQLIRTVNVVSDQSAKFLSVKTPAKPWKDLIARIIPSIQYNQKNSATPPSVKGVSKKDMVAGFIDKYQSLEEKYRAFNMTVEGNAVGGMTYGYISIDIKGTPEAAGKQLKQILRKEGLKPLKVETMEGDDSSYYGDWGAAVATFEILLGESSNNEGAFSKFLKTKA